MRIPVSCDSCSNEFSASENFAGRRIKCPVCGEGVRVPLSGDEMPELPRRSGGGKKKTKGRENKSGGLSPLLVGLGAGGGIAVLGLLLLSMNGTGTYNLPAPPVSTALAQNAPATTPSVAPPGTEVAGGGNVPPVQPLFAAPDPVVTEKVKLESEPPPIMTMPELVARVEKSVVRIIVRSPQGASVGSGFVIDSDGSIMTNYHVIEGASSAVVEFDTGEKADVIGFTKVDKVRDLAIIKIHQDPKRLQQLPVAPALPEKGEKVAAFGAPRGLPFTASDGIISAIRHSPEFNLRKEGTYLQTTTPVSPGNSGGPLINMRGEVVGINSFKVDGENLNFAASATDIRSVIAEPEKAVTPLSPAALERVFTRKNPFSRAENLARTQRGDMLLGRISEAVIMMLPFAVDPTGNISSFVDREISKNLINKARWAEVDPRYQIKKNTAFVVVLIYFTEDPKKNPSAVELMCSVQIVARDVDKDGFDYTAIVYDEHKSLGKIHINSLEIGKIPNGMKKVIPEFFGNIVKEFRKAQRENESPSEVKKKD